MSVEKKLVLGRNDTKYSSVQSMPRAGSQRNAQHTEHSVSTVTTQHPSTPTSTSPIHIRYQRPILPNQVLGIDLEGVDDGLDGTTAVPLEGLLPVAVKDHCLANDGQQLTTTRAARLMERVTTVAPV